MRIGEYLDRKRMREREGKVHKPGLKLGTPEAQRRYMSSQYLFSKKKYCMFFLFETLSSESFYISIHHKGFFLHMIVLIWYTWK